MLVMPTALAALYVAAMFLSTAPPYESSSIIVHHVMAMVEALRIHRLGCSHVVLLS